jgi:hypothetical protein
MRVASVVTTEKEQMHAAMRSQACLTTGQRQVDNMALGLHDNFILAYSVCKVSHAPVSCSATLPFNHLTHEIRLSHSCCSHLGHRASVKRSVSLQFLNPTTIGRTPWTGDQPVARPLRTQTQNKR